MPCLLALEGILLLAERFGWFTFDRHKGYVPLVTIAAVGAALLVMLFLVSRCASVSPPLSILAPLAHVAGRSGRHPVQLAGDRTESRREQHEAVEAIRKLGGEVTYDYEDADTFVTSPWPAWLRERLGVDLLANVTGAIFFTTDKSEVGDAVLEHLKGLTQLQWLYLDGTAVSDAGLVHLKGLSQLKELVAKGHQGQRHRARTPQRIDPT